MENINLADATAKQVIDDIVRINHICETERIAISSTSVQHIWQVYSIENGKTWIRTKDFTDQQIKEIILERR